jgi:glycosyltransferase involved in cell wall biosynthesis
VSRARLLVVGHEASRTGAPIVLLTFLRWLRANADVDVEVLLLDGGDLVADFRSVASVHALRPKAFHHKLPERLLIRAGRAGAANALRDARLRRAMKSLTGFDAVLVNTVVGGKAVPYLPPHGPVVTVVHELEYALTWGMPREHLDAVLRTTDQWVAVADAVRDNLVGRHGVPADRVVLCREFVDVRAVGAPDPEAVAALRRSLGLADGTPVVGSCGTPDWRKGVDLFQQLALRDGSGTAYVWVGGPTDNLNFGRVEHDQRLMGLDGRATFTGSLASPAAALALFDVFVLTAREDPFPLVCLEAAALGTPIVCFAGAGGMPEFVRDDAGVVVPYGDVTALHEAVRALLADPARRARLGAVARERALAECDVSVVAPLLWSWVEAALR